MTEHDDNAATFTQRTVDLALTNVENGGKPFACVVVDRESGKVVHEATNQVSQTGDVTSHAEITAIRELAASGRTDLSGCDVYVTAYPCPMCLGALYYAAPERVYYAASRDQEDEHYEDGGRYMTLATFYDEYVKAASEQNLPSTHVPTEDPTAPFRLWTSRNEG
ncbi:MAG: nucleoside deaminase [Marmoricola sp.]